MGGVVGLAWGKVGLFKGTTGAVAGLARGRAGGDVGLEDGTEGDNVGLTGGTKVGLGLEGGAKEDGVCFDRGEIEDVGFVKGTTGFGGLDEFG